MMNLTIALMSEGFGERASTSGIVTLLGMGAVFVVLAILWAAIEIMHRLLHKGESNKKEVSVQGHAAETVASTEDDPAMIAAITAAIAAEQSAVVAAITAAISASLAEEGHTGGFRVVSFKRVGTAKNRRNF